MTCSKNTRSEPRAATTAVSASTESVKLQEQLTQLQTELGLKAIEQQEQQQLEKGQEQKQEKVQQQEEALTSGSGKAETRTVFTGEQQQHQKQASVKASQKKSGTGQQQLHKHNPKKPPSAVSLKSSGNYNQPAGASKAGAAVGEVEKLQKAEGSLSGLASLKRVGNVKVISDAEGRNSTIKAKFTLGPLTLRVEKSFKRGSVRSVKSATARTNEMIGRIKFSVLDDRATLMSIKVQQPKQVSKTNKTTAPLFDSLCAISKLSLCLYFSLSLRSRWRARTTMTAPASLSGAARPKSPNWSTRNSNWQPSRSSRRRASKLSGSKRGNKHTEFSLFPPLPFM